MAEAWKIIWIDDLAKQEKNQYWTAGPFIGLKINQQGSNLRMSQRENQHPCRLEGYALQFRKSYMQLGKSVEMRDKAWEKMKISVEWLSK